MPTQKQTDIQAALERIKGLRELQQMQITVSRGELIEQLLGLHAIGGSDQSEQSLIDLLNDFPEGIELSLLKNVFADAVVEGGIKKNKVIRKKRKGGKVFVRIIAGSATPAGQ